MEHQYISVRVKDDVAELQFNRPDKRNAVNAAFLGELEAFFNAPPTDARAVIIHAAGPHFCAGLDLADGEMTEPLVGLRHGRRWHAVMQRIRYGELPILCALHGGVIGGGMEIMACAHVRVAEPGTFFALPEGQRGVFVGGGATVNVTRLIGPGRVTEMMLTGRRYDAQKAEALGLVHYVANDSSALERCRALAQSVIKNAAFSNYLSIHAVAHVAEMPESAGYFAENMAATLVRYNPEAQTRIKAFLSGRKA